MRSDPPLHCQILRQVAGVRRTLHLVGVSGVPLIRLNPLAGVKEVMQKRLKILMSVYLPAGKGPWIHTRSPPRMLTSNSQLVAKGTLPRVFVGRECVPLRRHPLLGDAKISAVDCHKTVV